MLQQPTKCKTNKKRTQQKNTIPVINYWQKNLQLRQYTICPLQQNCLSNNIQYRANITPIDENSQTKVYYGICETKFKLRHANHKKQFNHRNCKLHSELSNKFQKIKDNKRGANITWEIFGRHQEQYVKSKTVV